MDAIKNQINSAVIDNDGVFKYIQINIEHEGETYTIVRGFKNCPYHADIFQKFREEECNTGEMTSSAHGLPPYNWASGGDNNYEYKLDCPGGGRIAFEAEEKKITIYGYSQGFGRADHSISKELLDEAYPDHEITWNNEGY